MIAIIRVLFIVSSAAGSINRNDDFLSPSCVLRLRCSQRAQNAQMKVSSPPFGGAITRYPCTIPSKNVDLGQCGVCHQKLNLSANCITRGSAERVVILPKAELLKLRSGRPNCGVLKALNISQRSSKLRPSPKNPNVRANEKSKFVRPGPRRMLRPQVPNRFCGSG